MIHFDNPLIHAIARMRDTEQDLLFFVDGDELIGSISTYDIVVRGLARDRDIAVTVVTDVVNKQALSRSLVLVMPRRQPWVFQADAVAANHVPVNVGLSCLNVGRLRRCRWWWKLL